MSYSITIAGHSPNPHNDDVKAIVYETVKKLKALEGTVSLTGYTYDSSSVNFPLNDAFVADEELREQAASAPPVEEAPEVDATPKAVEHAEATGVDITQVEGTGAGGKVTKADVEAAAASQTPESGA